MLPKKHSKGVIRNRLQQLQDFKKGLVRKKKRFQLAGKDPSELDEVTLQPKSNEQFGASLMSTAQNSSSSSDLQSEPPAVTAEYQQARQKLQRVHLLQKKISALSRTRLQSFKESETQQLDKSINDLAAQAMQVLGRLMQCIVGAEKHLKSIGLYESKNPIEAKLVRNMQVSLASQLREATRVLRTKEKEYFGKLKAYEKDSLNAAIELTPIEKEKMKSDVPSELQEDEMVELERERDEQINELVKNINKLSSIYKQLNQLVIDQGSIIDRIDYNIEGTLTHTQKAVQHLRGAEKHASSAAADKCIKILLLFVLIGALALAFKYSSSN